MRGGLNRRGGSSAGACHLRGSPGRLAAASFEAPCYCSAGSFPRTSTISPPGSGGDRVVARIARETPMQPLRIRMRDDDVKLAVPADLSAMSTYVLLEQEAWFEKEPTFLRRWLKPGMTAIDIGANLGVYALPMARLVRPRGRGVAHRAGPGGGGRPG